MSEENKAFGKIEWVDLTVPDADRLRDFYSGVIGWRPEAVTMGEYNDWSMLEPSSGRAQAGVCHARGVNEGIPPQWLIYVTVADLDLSMQKCLALGGKVVHGPRNLGEGSRFCVIQDPAGAVMGLFQQTKSQ